MSIAFGEQAPVRIGCRRKREIAFINEARLA
jgi:hypothetical protein